MAGKTTLKGLFAFDAIIAVSSGISDSKNAAIKRTVTFLQIANAG